MPSYARSINAGEQGTFNLSFSSLCTGDDANPAPHSFPTRRSSDLEPPVLTGATSATVNEGGLVTLGAIDSVFDPDDTLGTVTISGLPGDLTSVKIGRAHV